MATRSPPPALEQPSTTPSPAATIPEARNCRSPALKPSIRSDSTVVRYCAEPTSAPDRVSTAVSFVNVLPKSTSRAGAVNSVSASRDPPDAAQTRSWLPSSGPDMMTSALLRQESAVNDQLGTGHIACLVGDEVSTPQEISADWAPRPIGVAATTAAFDSSPSSSARGVITRPGHTLLTRILSPT